MRTLTNRRRTTPTSATVAAKPPSRRVLAAASALSGRPQAIQVMPSFADVKIRQRAPASISPVISPLLARQAAKPGRSGAGVKTAELKMTQPRSVPVPEIELSQVPAELLDDLTASWVNHFLRRLPAARRPRDGGFADSLRAAWRPVVAQWASSPDFVKPPADSAIVRQAGQVETLTELDAPPQQAAAAVATKAQRTVQRQPEFVDPRVAATDILYGRYDPLRDPAIPNRAQQSLLRGQTPPDLGSKIFGYVATNALLPAIQSTRFYQRFEVWAQTLWRRQWPWIVAGLATAGVGLTISGVQFNEWRPMAMTADLLTLIPTIDIDINDRIQLRVRVSDESIPIRNNEEGTVIGLNPRLGFQYMFPNGATLGVGGGVNMRFQTGQGTSQGPRFNAMPSGNLTFRWRFWWVALFPSRWSWSESRLQKVQ